MGCQQLNRDNQWMKILQQASNNAYKFNILQLHANKFTLILSKKSSIGNLKMDLHVH